MAKIIVFYREKGSIFRDARAICVGRMVLTLHVIFFLLPMRLSANPGPPGFSDSARRFFMRINVGRMVLTSLNGHAKKYLVSLFCIIRMGFWA